jgi:predicted nuclease of predicted toxin-antitoxin system
MKLLIDANLSPQWCEKLQSEGFEAVHWSSIGALNAEDDVLFDWVAANGAVVLTHDLGFAAIHARMRTHGPSIVQIRSNEVDPAIIGDLVVRVLRKQEATLRDGAIVSIDVPRARIRRLPLT